MTVGVTIKVDGGPMVTASIDSEGQLRGADGELGVTISVFDPPAPSRPRWRRWAIPWHRESA